MDQANTMRTERSLSEAAFLRYGFHLVYQLVEGITRKIYILVLPHILSKEAYGSGEHNETRAMPLQSRISEIRLPLGVMS